MSAPRQHTSLLPAHQALNEFDAWWQHDYSVEEGAKQRNSLQCVADPSITVDISSVVVTGVV